MIKDTEYIRTNEVLEERAAEITLGTFRKQK
jgi:hypothetical protein